MSSVSPLIELSIENLNMSLDLKNAGPAWLVHRRGTAGCGDCAEKEEKSFRSAFSTVLPFSLRPPRLCDERTCLCPAFAWQVKISNFPYVNQLLTKA